MLGDITKQSSTNISKGTLGVPHDKLLTYNYPANTITLDSGSDFLFL